MTLVSLFYFLAFNMRILEDKKKVERCEHDELMNEGKEEIHGHCIDEVKWDKVQ